MCSKEKKTQGEIGSESGIELNKCPTCIKLCKDNVPAIECNICHCWYHTACIKMSPRLYEALQDDADDIVVFTCKRCKTFTVPLMEKMVDIQQRQIKLEAEVKSIQTNKVDREDVHAIVDHKLKKLDINKKMDTMLQHVKDDIDDKIMEKCKQELPVELAKLDLENKIEAKVSSLENKIARTYGDMKPTEQQDVRTTVMEVFTEQEDIERRRNNIIIHGLPEIQDNIETPGHELLQSDDEVAASNNKKTDKEQIIDLLKPISDGIQLGQYKRLGAKSETGTRPVLVSLNSNTKSMVFKNIKKLRESNPTISISHDLPKVVRERRKKLILDAKLNKGEHSEDFLYKFKGPLGRESVLVVKKQNPS